MLRKPLGSSENSLAAIMDHQELFSDSIRKHFAYLIDEFDFSMVENQYQESSAGCVVAFQNKTRYVKLIWGLRDEAFYFGAYRVLSNGEPVPYQDHGTNQFYIPTLAKHYEPTIDMGFLSEMAPDHPDVQRVLDEKIAVNAQLLRRYGNDILAGRQWFDQISQKLIPEAGLTSTGNASPLEKTSANILVEPPRSATRGYYPVDSPDPHPTLPMWLVLLVIGGVALCIGAAVIIMMR